MEQQIHDKFIRYEITVKYEITVQEKIKSDLENKFEIIFLRELTVENIQEVRKKKKNLRKMINIEIPDVSSEAAKKKYEQIFDYLADWKKQE